MTENCSKQYCLEIEDDYIMTELCKSNLTSSIQGKLCERSPIPSKCSIFRVPQRFRRQNESRFEPALVSIGPFHHGKKNLQAMEKIKLWYLHCLLSRAPTRKTTLKCFIEAIESIEQECRACYAEEFDHLVGKKFIEMMVVDGCFIIEFFRKASNEVRQDKEDPVFNTSWMAWEITNDLFLLENQLPWRVLDCLFNLTQSNAERRSLLNLLSSFPKLVIRTRDDHQIQYKHLLHCLQTSYAETYTVTHADRLSFFKVNPIPSATELLKVGVEFESGLENSLNVTFRDGVMTIPIMQVSEITECISSNLIVFEHCDPIMVHKITSFIKILKDLINTTKDVDFLRQREILQTSLSSEKIVGVFNQSYNDAYDYVFLYSHLYGDVNAYYRRRQNRWRYILKHDYFNNPWTSLSIIAATLILLFTLLQTTYSIISYHRSTS